MLFGSYGGLTVFDPEKVIESSYRPPVMLTDFQLLGQPVQIGGDSVLKQSISLTNSLVLNHAQDILSFEFAALSYASPERNRYRYRLEGLETVWHEVHSNRRTVMYTTLPPGAYVFRVNGSDARGEWNDAGVTLRLRVLPPMWATWWFRTVCAVFVMALACALYQLRVGNLERQFNIRLEERVGERTRIARELHDTLLQSFQGLMLRFQLVDELLPARPGEAKQALERLSLWGTRRLSRAGMPFRAYVPRRNKSTIWNKPLRPWAMNSPQRILRPSE